MYTLSASLPHRRSQQGTDRDMSIYRFSETLHLLMMTKSSARYREHDERQDPLKNEAKMGNRWDFEVTNEDGVRSHGDCEQSLMPMSQK